MSKPTDGISLLTYARSAASVLLTLRLTDQTMTYGAFTIAIGLRRDGEAWQWRWMEDVKKILNSAYAVDQYAPVPTLTDEDFKRLITERTGEPGAGFYRTPKIAFED
jgi:hypothetical protein